MNKNVIKVVKRNGIDKAEKIKVVVNTVKSERKIQTNLVKGVNNWIFERRRNSRMEKVYSYNKILEWKILPEIKEN